MAETPSTPAVLCTPAGGSAFLIAALVSAGVTVAGWFWMQRHLDRALAVRPPVVVLDLAGAVRATAPAQLPALLDAARTAAERLAGEGVLVLERSAVLAVPPGLTLSDREVWHAAD